MEKKDLPVLEKGKQYVLYWAYGNVSKCLYDGEKNGFLLFKNGLITIPVRISSLKNLKRVKD